MNFTLAQLGWGLFAFLDAVSEGERRRIGEDLPFIEQFRFYHGCESGSVQGTPYQGDMRMFAPFPAFPAIYDSLWHDLALLTKSVPVFGFPRKVVEVNNGMNELIWN